MKCPHCQKQAIAFSQWCQGANAFRTKCVSCGTKLKATKSTYLAALISAVIILAITLWLLVWAEEVGLSRRGLKLLILVGAGIPIGAVAYRFCGYNKDEGGPSQNRCANCGSFMIFGKKDGEKHFCGDECLNTFRQHIPSP